MIIWKDREKKLALMIDHHFPFHRINHRHKCIYICVSKKIVIDWLQNRTCAFFKIILIRINEWKVCLLSSQQHIQRSIQLRSITLIKYNKLHWWFKLFQNHSVFNTFRTNLCTENPAKVLSSEWFSVGV